MRRRLRAAAALGLGVLLGAGPPAAVAHPQLVNASPQPGAVAPKAPRAVTLAFSEDSIARASSLRVTGPDGAVRVGRLRAGSLHGTLSASLGSLRPAIYRVRWSAVGRDGHRVSGDFAFGVARRDGRPPPGAAGLSAGGSRGGDAAGPGAFTSVARWLGLLTGSLLFGGSLALAALRRRRLLERGAIAGPAAVRLAGVGAVTFIWAAGQGAIAAASVGEHFDLGLLMQPSSGRLALARLVLALAGPIVLLAARRLAVAGALGALVLATYALDGHALEGAWPLFALHGLAAGAWAGAVFTLVVAGARRRVAWAPAVRAVAPLAGGALVVLAATGVLVAVHEIDRTYFLRWSAYGQVVIAKSAIVVLAATLGAAGFLRARRATGPGGRARLAGGAAIAAPRAAVLARVSPKAVRAEAVLLGAALLLAAVLSGLLPGRGRPLPAQQGTLLPGPAIATALGPAGQTRLALAPARPGSNVLSVIPPGHPRALAATLRCACGARPVRVTLHRGAGAAWSAAVELPRGGTWIAEVDGATATLPVGVPSAPGAKPRDLLAIADLSGPGAERCRAHVVGLELAIGRINAAGGIDGGRKLAPLVLDSGGSATRAAALARGALRRGAVAMAGACGAGAEAAVVQAGARGVPSIVGDPAVEPIAARDTFRLAGDPAAAGVAIGQAIRKQVLPFSLPSARTIAVSVAHDAAGTRFLTGLRAALAHSRRRVAVTNADAAIHRLDRRRTAAVVLDAPDAAAPRLAARLARAGSLAPAPVFASERLLSERFVRASGRLGRLGVVQGATTVVPEARDALAIVRAIPALWPGERPSLDALRGYATGLALRAALRGGSDGLAARLLRPAPFTDALSAPWRSDAPAAGSPRLMLVVPRFLAATLIPPSQGGESFDGSWFSDGSWTRASTEVYGPSLREPVAPLPPLPRAGG